MVIVMDMNTGTPVRPDSEEAVAEEFGAFVDEVLNAGWLPQPEARIEVQMHEKNPTIADVDAFLRALYLNQE